MKKTILALALTTLAFSSCKKGATEFSLDRKDKGTSMSTELKELRLAIHLPNSITLRSGSSTDDPMRKVKTLRVVFYSTEESPKVVEVFDLSVASASALSNLSLKLAPKAYQLVVIANASDYIREQTRKGSPLSNLTTGKVFHTNHLMRFDSSSELPISMLNEQGVLQVREEQFSAETPLSVAIEPAVARLLVYGTPTVRGGQLGSASAGYLLAGVQREGFLLRQLAILSTGIQEQAGDGSSRATRYSKMPVWQVWGSSVPTSVDGVLHYSTEQSENKPWRPIQGSLEQASQHYTNPNLYSREATVPDNAQLIGLAPSIILRYAYIPDGLTLSQGEGWLRFRGELYSETQVKQMLTTSTYPNEALRNAFVANSINAASFNAGFQLGELEFFHKAYSYYVVHIKHFTATESPSGYGRYGIVRGNEYRLNVQSIQRSGSPTIPNLSEDLSPIVEAKELAISAQIMELSIRSQEAEL